MYGQSPGNKAYCHAELVVSSLTLAMAIVDTVRAYHGGTTRLSWPGDLYPPVVTRLATNPARCSIISFYVYNSTWARPDIGTIPRLHKMKHINTQERRKIRSTEIQSKPMQKIACIEM